MSEKVNKQNTKTFFEMDEPLIKTSGKSNANQKKERARKTSPFSNNMTIPEAETVEQQTTPVPNQKTIKPEKKSPYFEPNKSAKLSEDVITKVKMLTPFIHKRHGYDLRATNSFIDIVIDFYVENALDENEQEDFKKIYEVMTAPKRDSK